MEDPPERPVVESSPGDEGCGEGLPSSMDYARNGICQDEGEDKEVGDVEIR